MCVSQSSLANIQCECASVTLRRSQSDFNNTPALLRCGALMDRHARLSLRVYRCPHTIPGRALGPRDSNTAWAVSDFKGIILEGKAGFVAAWAVQPVALLESVSFVAHHLSCPGSIRVSYRTFWSILITLENG